MSLWKGILLLKISNWTALHDTCSLSDVFFTFIQILLHLNFLERGGWGGNAHLFSLSLSQSLPSASWLCLPRLLLFISNIRAKNVSLGSHSPAIALADFCKWGLMQGCYARTLCHARILCHINGSFHMPSSNDTHPTHSCSKICHWFTFSLEATNTTGWYPAIRIHSSTAL